MKKRNKLLPLVIILIILCVSLIIGVVVISQNNRDSNAGNFLPIDNAADDWNGNQELPKASLGDKPAIAIPGFNELVFIADQTTQKVNFYNPEINDCLFLMRLYVDEELLWQSGYVKPGDGYYEIELSRALPEGENFKNGCLRIQCYKLDGTTLNSAKVNFKLMIVKGDE